MIIIKLNSYVSFFLLRLDKPSQISQEETSIPLGVFSEIENVVISGGADCWHVLSTSEANLHGCQVLILLSSFCLFYSLHLLSDMLHMILYLLLNF